MKGNSAYVNEFSLTQETLSLFGRGQEVCVQTPFPGVQVVDDLLRPEERDGVLRDLERQNWIPVGVNGMKGDYTPGDRIGSWRQSCFEPVFADALYQRLRVLGRTWSFDGYTTENGDHKDWRFVGVNPLFRFIKYERGGVLVPHYDRAFSKDDKTTLVSLVLYFTSSGARTRFIKDDQRDVPVSARDLSDWPREARLDEVVWACETLPGRGLMFDHCVLHDSEPHVGETAKIIARTDLVFEKC